MTGIPRLRVWSRILSVAILLALVLATAPAALGSGEDPHALGSTVDVPPGGDLQAALDAAQPGDTILLTAGATYTGWFTLPVKAGNEQITIRTSTPDSSLPPAGVRVNPSHFSLLARVNANPGGSVFTAAAGAHHYRFLGLEISPTPGSFLYNVVLLGDGSETSVAQLPHDIVFERCYIHGDQVAGSRRGIAMNGVNITVVDSRVSDFKEVGADSQALAGWGGAGPFTIVNNYLEGAGENVLFGGADASLTGVVPSDIVVRHNHFLKPLRWKTDDPSYEGTHWSVKNLFELKVGRRVLVEGNVLEQNWVDAQVGTAILFTVRNQDGGSPWSQIDHVTFRNNIVRHTGDGFDILGYDNNFPSQQTNNVTIANNLLYDVATAWGGWGAFALVLNGTADITLDHNTVLQNGHILLADLLPNAGFVFTNNISPHNEYGVFGSGRASGNDSLNAYFPGAVFRRNLIPGAPAATYPVDNFYPTNLSDAKFVDLAGGNYRLSGASPYRAAGTDGKDVGADIDGVEAATCGAINGTYCPPAVGLGTVLMILTVVAAAAVAIVALLARRRRRRSEQERKTG